MNRLLKAQLKKVYGKNFDLHQQDEQLQKFIALVEQGYEDLYQERKLLEQTLRVNASELTELNKATQKNHDLIRSVTNSVSDIIFYKDLNFRYIGCNKHFEKLVGSEEYDIIGKDDYDIFDKQYADTFRKMDMQMLQSAEKQINTEWVKYPDGRDVYLSTHKSPLFSTEGSIIGIVGVSHDITKEYELTKDLEIKRALLIQQNRLASMGEMLGNIAHQWRQPLNALGLVIQKIGFFHKRGSLSDERLQTNIDKSVMLIDNMSQTIDDFRDFFNPNKAKEQFNINQLIEKVYTIIEPVIKTHSIEYEFHADEELSMNGFKNELSQVILNLLNNAKDALIENKIKNKLIMVRLMKKNGTIIIEVEDNAGGIDNNILEKIFDPYFTTKADGKGSGLGLYMSKIIIEEHMAGSLSVESTMDRSNFIIKI